MTPALHSVSYAGYWGQAALNLPQFIARAAKLGYASVTLVGKRPHLSPLEATPELIASLKAALKKAHLRCDVMAGYTNLAQPVGAGCEVPLIEFQIAYVESVSYTHLTLPTNREV